MNFRKELVKELGLGVIAENTMLDDYVRACEKIAIRYHDSMVKNLNIPTTNHVCRTCKGTGLVYIDEVIKNTLCPDC